MLRATIKNRFAPARHIHTHRFDVIAMLFMSLPWPPFPNNLQNIFPINANPAIMNVVKSKGTRPHLRQERNDAINQFLVIQNMSYLAQLRAHKYITVACTKFPAHLVLL